MADSNDEGIGSTGTIPVDPSNPLYDAVKSGGGFVEDEDGNVTGGPDGDGTARTEEERTSNSDSESSGGGSGGSSSGSGGGSGGSSGSSGGSSGGGSSGGVRERARNIKDRAFEQVQKKTDAALDRDDVTISRDGDSLSAEFTSSGRRKEAVADRKKELAADVPGATADDVVIEEPNQQLINSVGTGVPVDDIPARQDSPEAPTKSTQADTGGQSLADQGRRQRDSETGEAFGGQGAAEEALRDFSRDFREGVSDPVADVTGDVADIAQSGAAVSAAGNPALILSGASDPGQIEQEVRQGPERLRDVARAPENEQSTQRRFERFGGGVGRGAAEIANVPAIGVAAIEAGEVGAAGAEAAVDGELGEFANTASAAGAAQAGDVARVAGENPAQFGGQVVGGAVAGFAAGGAASSAARRAARQARRSDAGAADIGSGVRERARAFAADDRGQADMTGLFRDRDSDQTIEIAEPEPEPPASLDQRTDFTDREVATRDRRRREEGGMTDEERFQSGRGDTLMERRARRRREKAQRSEVRQTDDVAGEGNLFDFQAGGTGVGALAGVGLQEQAQQAEATRQNSQQTARNGVGVDSGVGLDVGSGVGPDTPPARQGQPTDTDIGAGFDFGFGQPPQTRTPDRTGTSASMNGPRPPARTGDTPNRPPRPPDSDDDDDGQLDLFGGSGGQSADGDAVSGAATGFVAETLAGFGEGGLNLDAAQAADSADSGFLSTRAESSDSAGFEAARDLFTFGGDS